NGLTIGRDAAGRIASITYAPGKTATYTYDTRGLLSGISDWAGGSVQFTYDAAARMIGINRANGVITQISYDANGRVIAIAERKSGNVLAAIALQRDAIGRVTTASRDLPQEPVLVPNVRAQTVDAASQLAGVSYDGLGRVTQDSLRRYRWGVAPQLMGYTSAEGQATFTYDAFGMRISRTPAGGSAQSSILHYPL